MRCNDCELMLTSLNTRRDLYTMFIRRALRYKHKHNNIRLHQLGDHIEHTHTQQARAATCYIGYLFFRSDWDIYRGYFILDWLNLFFRMDLCVLGITICDALLGLAVKRTTRIKIRFSLDSSSSLLRVNRISLFVSSLLYSTIDAVVYVYVITCVWWEIDKMWLRIILCDFKLPHNSLYRKRYLLYISVSVVAKK